MEEHPTPLIKLPSLRQIIVLFFNNNITSCYCQIIFNQPKKYKLRESYFLYDTYTIQIVYVTKQNLMHWKKNQILNQAHEESITRLKPYEYVRTMGSYKPKFEGVPDEYFPLTRWEGLKYSLFVLLIIGGNLGVMVGLLFWILKQGLQVYVIVWSIALIVFVMMMIVLFYIGGRGRIREEKILIAEQQRKQEELKENK